MRSNHIPRKPTFPKSRAFSVLLILTSIIHPSAILLMATFILASYIFAERVPRRFFRTKLSSTILGMCLISAGAGTLATILWVIHVGISLHLILLGTIIVALIYSWNTPKQTIPEEYIDYKDCVAGFVIIAYISMMLLGVVRQTPISNSSLKGSVIQSVTYGIDDISHLMMYQDTVLADNGLLLGMRDIQKVGKQSNASYPKMSHTIAAMFHGSLENKRTNIIFAYALTKYFIFILLIYMLCRSSLEGVKGVHSLIVASVVTPILLFITVLVLHVFFEEGFFSIWPVIAYSPLVLLFMRENTNKRTVNLLLVSSLVVAITMSWPIMGLPLYSALALEALLMRPKYIKQLVAISFSLIGTLQLYVQFFDKSAKLNQSEINAVGGIPTFPALFLVGIGVCTLLATFARASKERAHGTFSSIYISATLAMTSLIAYINIHSTGSVQYFYTKSALLMCLVFITVLLPVFIPYIIDRINELRLSLVSASIVGVGLSVAAVLSLPLLVGAEQNVMYSSSYLIGGQRHLTNQSAQAMLVSNNQLQNVIFISTDSKIENYYTNALIGGLNGFNTCQIAGQTLGIANIGPTVASLDKSCKDSSASLMIIDNPTVHNEVSCQDIASMVSKIRQKVASITYVNSDECKVPVQSSL